APHQHSDGNSYEHGKGIAGGVDGEAAQQRFKNFSVPEQIPGGEDRVERSGNEVRPHYERYGPPDQEKEPESQKTVDGDHRIPVSVVPRLVSLVQSALGKDGSKWTMPDRPATATGRKPQRHAERRATSSEAAGSARGGRTAVTDRPIRYRNGWPPFSELSRLPAGTGREDSRIAAHAPSVLQRDKGERVVGVHRDHQLVGSCVVTHGCSARDRRGDQFRRSIWRNTGNASLTDAAEISRPILHDDDTAVSRLRRLLGLEKFSLWRESEHVFVAYVHDSEISFAVKGDAVGQIERIAFDTHH